jgi:hypothetical protein
MFNQRASEPAIVHGETRQGTLVVNFKTNYAFSDKI